MAITLAVSAHTSRPQSQALHFTRQELKEYINGFQITAIEKLTKVFGGLPCRTVKVFPLPDDFEPDGIEDFFADVPGHVVATLTFTENEVRAMFVGFSIGESVIFALKKHGQSIIASQNEFAVNIQVLADTEFHKFLQAIMLESLYLMHGEEKRRFEHPDENGTTLSEELDHFLSVFRSTLDNEKRIATEKKKAKDAASTVGFEVPEDESGGQENEKLNKFEIAYANKKVKAFDVLDHLPKSILPLPTMIQRPKERTRKRQARFGYLMLGSFVVTAVVGCYLFQRMSSRVGGVNVIAEPTNFVP